MQQIAEAAGVSRMAVSLALRNSPKISAATGDRIREIAASLSYRPNPLVSALMTQLRSSKEVRKLSTLAYVTAHSTAAGWRMPGPFASFYEGAKRRAEALGYTLEDWWLREPGMTDQRFSDILYTRDIHGVIIAPMPPGGGTMALDWRRFASATIGYSLTGPNLHRASNDQYSTITLALRELRKLGYRRVGMAIPAESDERVKHNWSAGMLVHQQQIAPEERVPSLLSNGEFHRDFAEWFQVHRPEAILGVNERIVLTLSGLEVRVPEDVGFAHLALSSDDVEFAGVNQNSEVVGASALELVDAQLRRNERGIPEIARTLLVPGKWVSGPTVRRQAQPAEVQLSNV